jgi:hypothetical protein
MKQYRTVQYRSDNDELEEVVHEGNRWKEAHFQCLQYDGDYWPEFYHVVERSLDGGATWQIYDADEMINGRPAWTYDDL